MMRRMTITLAVPLVLTMIGPEAHGQGRFAAGSQAESWGLFGEEKAKFEGRIVDVLCTLTGDCPVDCGAGKRQMAIMRTTDSVLVLVTKNGQPLFTGATVDLAPYCGQTVTVDGLLVGDPELTVGLKTKVFQVQTIHPLNGAEPVKTERWTEEWSRRTALPESEEPWFARDPRVKSVIDADGHFGLGAEADEVYRRENP